MNKLFKTLQIIVRHYSRLPVRKLIDSDLFISLFVNISYHTLVPFIQELNLSRVQSSLFLRHKRNVYCMLVLDHSLYLDIGSDILKLLDTCIILDAQFKQYNNFLDDYTGHASIKGVIFQTSRFPIKELYQQLDAYLSIVELFHSHIHLKFTAQETNTTTMNNADIEQDINKNIQHNKLDKILGEDEFEQIVERGGFVKILEERASKVTLTELSENCQITAYNWGQVFEFKEGVDGLIVWLTQGFYPVINGEIPLIQNKTYHLHIKGQVGYCLYLAKGKPKELISLGFTTLIFNVDKERSMDWEFGIEKIEAVIKAMKAKLSGHKQEKKVLTQIKMVQKLCNILQIDPYLLIKKMFF